MSGDHKIDDGEPKPTIKRIAKRFKRPKRQKRSKHLNVSTRRLLRDMATADTGLFDDPDKALEVWRDRIADDDVPGHRG
jgi:hypothetical protein